MTQSILQLAVSHGNGCHEDLGISEPSRLRSPKISTLRSCAIAGACKLLS